MKNRNLFTRLVMILGILMIALGVFNFIRPNAAMTAFVLLYAVIIIITGIFDILMYVKAEEYTGFGPIVALVCGVLSVMAGVILLFYPNAGTLIFYLLFPIWFITHSIFLLANLKRLHWMIGTFWYYFLMVSCILGVILSFLMILHPFASFKIISYFVSVDLILSGINGIVLAYRHRGTGW